MKNTQQHTPSIASLNSLEANYQLLSRKALMKTAPKTADKAAVAKKIKASSIEDVISIETDTDTLTASVLWIDPSQLSDDALEKFIAEYEKK